jgi:5-methyltetrahydrofolate--homocysteine methyltransferase
MADFTAIKEALVAIDQERLVGLVNSALAEKVPAPTILNDGLISAMDIIGGKMETGEMFIPEVLMAAQAMGQCVDILKPLLGDANSSSAGTVLIGTVKGDLHDIGKNLVIMMLESAGLTVHDLGVDIAPETFVAKIKEIKPQIVCLSALLTTTMPMLKETIEAIDQAGLRDQVKIMVGGAPVNQEYADKIGADGFAPDAGSAARFAKNLLN